MENKLFFFSSQFFHTNGLFREKFESGMEDSEKQEAYLKPLLLQFFRLLMAFTFIIGLFYRYPRIWNALTKN